MRTLKINKAKSCSKKVCSLFGGICHVHKEIQHKVEISPSKEIQVDCLCKGGRWLAMEKTSECLEEIAYSFQICQYEQAWSKHVGGEEVRE